MLNKTRFKIYTFFLFIFFTVLFLEILVRIIVDNGKNLSLEMMKYAKDYKIISQDKKIGIEHRKNISGKLMGVKVNLNSNGLRNNFEIKEDTRKVLMIGDSMTFGWGAQKPFSKILNELLGDKYQILNAGIGNTNTKMQINNFFKNYSEIDIETIVINFFINDLEDVKIEPYNIIQKHFYIYTFINTSFHEVLIRLGFKPNWKAFYRNTFKNEKILNETFDEILKLKKFCMNNDIKLIINNIPELKDLKNYKFIKETEIISTFAENNGIKFINSYQILKNYDEKLLWVTNKDLHANDFAHSLIGEYLHMSLFNESDS